MRFAALIVFGLLVGCASETAAPTRATSGWAVVHRAFGEHFFEATARGPLFTPEAASALVLPGLLDPSRYRYLQVAELRRTGPDRRAGTVAFAVEGWPMALPIELTRGEAGWRISSVAGPDAQRALLDLLGPDGLPTSAAAEPWNGGLSGRDAVGRPTAAVLVVARGATAQVDGVPLPDAEPVTLVAAIRAGLEARARLAREAHSTYRPQVALAVTRIASALRHRALADHALAAGAEGLFLVVRDAKGGPARLPLARRGPRPPGPQPPPILTVKEDLAGVHLSVGRTAITVPHRRGALDRNGLGAALNALATERPDLAGARQVLGPDADHGHTVALLDALRTSMPELPVVTEAP